MTWLDSGGQGSKVKVTEGRRVGEDIHVDARRSSSSSSWSYEAVDKISTDIVRRAVPLR